MTSVGDCSCSRVENVSDTEISGILDLDLQLLVL